MRGPGVSSTRKRRPTKRQPSTPRPPGPPRGPRPRPGPAEAGDGPRLLGLTAGTETTAVLADKVYDSDADREAIRAAGAEPGVPPRKNRVVAIEYDRHLYSRSATRPSATSPASGSTAGWRHDKRARNYLGSVWLASINIILA